MSATVDIRRTKPIQNAAQQPYPQSITPNQSYPTVRRSNPIASGSRPFGGIVRSFSQRHAHAHVHARVGIQSATAVRSPDDGGRAARAWPSDPNSILQPRTISGGCGWGRGRRMKNCANEPNTRSSGTRFVQITCDIPCCANEAEPKPTTGGRSMTLWTRKAVGLGPSPTPVRTGAELPTSPHTRSGTNRGRCHRISAEPATGRVLLLAEHGRRVDILSACLMPAPVAPRRYVGQPSPRNGKAVQAPRLDPAGSAELQRHARRIARARHQAHGRV